MVPIQIYTKIKIVINAQIELIKYDDESIEILYLEIVSCV